MGQMNSVASCADNDGPNRISKVLAAVLLASAASGQKPSYMPVYQMNLSTIIMPCNFTGPINPSTTVGWGVIDIDNSNWKGTGDSDGWAKASPMDCEERLAKQVQMTKQGSPQTKVWVYRNSIIALPWYSSVRVKLEDPAYAYWFLNFTDPVPDIKQRGKANTTCDLNFDPPKCSMAFHETTHAPGYPDGDGNCAAPGCDVGSFPIGAYLFNPAAANHSVNGQTFTEWFVDEYVFGPNGGGNENISGFFFDDQFLPSGVTESQGNLSNLGLTKEQGEEYSAYYRQYMKVVYDEVLKRGKFSWQQMWCATWQKEGLSHTCRSLPGPLVAKANCAKQLRSLCSASSPQHTGRAMMYQFSGDQTEQLPEFEQDLANFLLVRGEHAWLGHGWKGCSHAYLFPEALNRDYGEPVEICKETADHSGVFTREWTKASVQMDCNTYTPEIQMKDELSQQKLDLHNFI